MSTVLKKRVHPSVLWGALIGLVAIGYGALATVKVISGWRAFRGAVSWPAVRALVVESTLIERLVSDSDGDTKTEYQPRFGYEYQVGGRRWRFESSFSSFSSLSRAQSFMARLPRFNDSVTVFYDPVSPGRSTTSRVHPLPVISLVLLGMLHVTGLGFVAVSVRAWIRAPGP